MFKVINKASAVREFRILLEQAASRGMDDVFADSATRMALDLSSDPLATGESRESEPVGGFLKRIAFYPLFCVQFGVHPTGKLVLITSISPRSGW